MNDLPDLSKAWSLCEAVYAFASDDDRKAELEWTGTDNVRVAQSSIGNITNSHPITRTLLEALQRETAVAYGRIGSMAENIARIPTYFWKSELEFKLRSTLRPNSAHWPGPPPRDIFDIRILRAEDATITKNARGAGRPPKFAWDAIIAEFMIYLGTKGMPDTQTQAIHEIEKIAKDIKGEVPAVETIRDHFRKHYPLLWEKMKNE